MSLTTSMPASLISIHAPRVGSDTNILIATDIPDNISIHAPRVGSDRNRAGTTTEALAFQSTLPVWGATL